MGSIPETYNDPKGIRYSMESNGTELAQIVHTNRTSCHGWPRGFGALNSSPHSE